jgi:hypothetical protein
MAIFAEIQRAWKSDLKRKLPTIWFKYAKFKPTPIACADLLYFNDY